MIKKMVTLDKGSLCNQSAVGARLIIYFSHNIVRLRKSLYHFFLFLRQFLTFLSQAVHIISFSFWAEPARSSGAGIVPGWTADRYSPTLCRRSLVRQFVRLAFRHGVREALVERRDSTILRLRAGLLAGCARWWPSGIATVRFV